MDRKELAFELVRLAKSLTAGCGCGGGESEEDEDEAVVARQAAMDLMGAVKALRKLVAGQRMPSSLRNRANRDLRKYRRGDVEDYETLFEMVQEIVFAHGDLPELDEDGYDIINDWTYEIADDWAKKLGVGNPTGY
jgi:hypothetical protein